MAKRQQNEETVAAMTTRNCGSNLCRSEDRLLNAAHVMTSLPSSAQLGERLRLRGPGGGKRRSSPIDSLAEDAIPSGAGPPICSADASPRRPKQANFDQSPASNGENTVWSGRYKGAWTFGIFIVVISIFFIFY